MSEPGSEGDPGSASAGRLEAIWRKRAHRGPMEPLPSVRLVEGVGLEGNADAGGRRQVTVIAREAWDRALEEVDREVDPAARRANLMVSGLELAETRGRRLAVGEARLLVHGETTPCHRMDEAADGLREALEPEWRGGVYAEVLREARVEVGDAVRWVEEVDDGSEGPADARPGM